MKKIKLNPVKCVGCKLCELNCSFAHYKLFSHDIGNVHVVTIEDTADFTPYVCLQCDARSCVDACPVEALSVNSENGSIIIDHDACIKCSVCVDACKYKGIRLIKYEGEEKIAVCDLCGGKEPRCAAACRENAIVFE